MRSLDWVADSSALIWERMGASFPASQGFSLFGTGGVSVHDVVQGSVGNCWFIAAAASVAEHAGRIEDMWLTQSYNDEGIYALNMYMLGVPTTIVIDDWIPHYGSTYNSIFAKVNHSGDKATWMLLLEKAFAKAMGNYAQLIAGWTHRGVDVLTGFPSDAQTHSNLTETQLWDYVDEGDANGDIMTASSHYGSGGDATANGDGIAYSHAYSVIGTTTVTDNAGTTTQLVKVRNPWGSENYSGDWSDGDTRWNNVSQSEKDRIGYTNSLSDGYFFMSVPSFSTNFRSTTINRDLTGWHHNHFLRLDDTYTSATSPGTAYYCGASCAAHRFTFTTSVTQDVYISAYLHDERSYPTDCNF